MFLHSRQLRKAIALLWITFFSCPVFPQTDSGSFTLNDIAMTGLKRFDPERLIAISGLRVGQQIAIPDIETAARKLADSGFFKSVAFKYGYTQRNLDIDFQVEEAADFLPCVFDNFVWFGDEELIGAINRKIPLFDNLIPQSGAAAQLAAEALQDLLRERRLPGTVTSMPVQAKLGGEISGLVFTITGINLPIHTITFPGAEGVSETELREKAKPLLGQNYSRSYVKKYANMTLAPLFRQKGYLRVKFSSPDAMLQTGPVPENALLITLGVDEGLAYAWDKAAWTGDFPFDRENLDRILGMKTGEPADDGKIKKGMEAVLKAAKNQGYLEIISEMAPEFDDSAGKVLFNIRLTAGLQYRMGSVTFKGVPDSVSGQLHAKWRLRPGYVFDASYCAKFIRSQLIGIRYRNLKTTVKPNRTKATVDVIIEFS